MPGTFLVPETVIQEAGTSTELDVSVSKGKLLQVTLGITRIIEQESLDVSVWGSADKSNWSARPLVSFPQKFYCGTYCMLVDLSDHPEVKYIRVQWKTARWGRGEPKPLFGFYIFIEESELKALTALV